MEDYLEPYVYERVISENEKDNTQIRLTINTFRDIEYLHLRKYYIDFDEKWQPTPNGVALPLTFDACKELFTGLVEILSLAESKQILEEHFKEVLDYIYLK